MAAFLGHMYNLVFPTIPIDRKRQQIKVTTAIYMPVNKQAGRRINYSS